MTKPDPVAVYLSELTGHSLAEVRDVIRTVKRADDRWNYRTDDRTWRNYGARRITFEFAGIYDAAHYVLTHLGPRPPGWTLDRMDNDKGYAPGNLRWASDYSQWVNSRSPYTFEYSQSRTRARSHPKK